METGRTGNKQKSKRMTRRRRCRIISQYVFALLFLMVIVVLVFMILKKYVNKTPENVICNNIFVGTTNVSGLTEKQAEQKLEKQYKKDKKTEISLRIKKKSGTITLAEAGLMEENIPGLAKEAVNYGKTGGICTRYRKIKRLEKEQFVIKPKYKIDKKITKDLLKERISPLIKGAKDSTISKKGSEFKITEEKEGKTADIETCITDIENHLNSKWNHKAFSINVKTIKEEPRIRKEDLTDIKDNLGSFFTYAGGGERWKNLKNGVDLINGTILMPGDKFSVYEATSPYNEENGYVQAGAYAGESVVTAYGGGICQVSTTLYNAAIYAELDVLSRSSHTMTVGYVEPSRDAAIAEGTMDLVIQNNLKYPVYIYGEINENNELRFVVYGKETRDKNRSIEFESETISEDKAGIEYRENAELDLGEEVYKGEPHSGKEARLWKVIYENGEEIDRSVFNTSVYQKSNQIIEIGTKCSNSDASAIVREAIASNDTEKIQGAVQKAYDMQN